MIFLLSKVKNQKVRLIPAGPARGHAAPPGTAPTPPTAPAWGLVLGVPQDFGGDSPEHTPPTRFCSPIFQHKGAGSVPRGDEEGTAVPAAPRRQLRHLTPSSQVGPGFGGKVPAPGPPTPLCSRRSWKSPPKPTGTQPIVRQRHHQPTSPSPVPQPPGFLENHLPARPRNRILPSAALQKNLGMITAKWPALLWCPCGLFFLHAATGAWGWEQEHGEGTQLAANPAWKKRSDALGAGEAEPLLLLLRPTGPGQVGIPVCGTLPTRAKMGAP